MSAEERLWWYSRFFDTVKVNSTFYALPSPDTAALWVARTQPGFLFSVKAYALLTGHQFDAARVQRGAGGLRRAPPGPRHRGGDPPRHCCAKLVAFMAPAAVLIVEAIPKNANGKTDRAPAGAWASRRRADRHGRLVDRPRVDGILPPNEDEGFLEGPDRAAGGDPCARWRRARAGVRGRADRSR